MDVSTWIMVGLAVVLLGIAWRRGGGTMVRGFQASAELFVFVMPRLLAAFVVGGLIEALVPPQTIAALLGRESGLRGLAIAWAAGALAPGGPIVSFPILASLYRAGAEPALVMTFLTSWSLIGLNRILIWELPLFGFHFTSFRFLTAVFLPPLVGFAARALYTR